MSYPVMQFCLRGNKGPMGLMAQVLVLCADCRQHRTREGKAAIHILHLGARFPIL